MIAEQVVQRPIFAHGDALSLGIIVFGDDSIRHFVVSAHEIGGGQFGFYVTAIAVISEA